MAVCGHFHVPAALPPGKDSLVSIEYKVAWAGVWTGKSDIYLNIHVKLMLVLLSSEDG
jgi:hypothetical protein